MKVLFLTRFGPLGASSRMRSYQYLSEFESAGIACVVSHLFGDAMLVKKYQQGGYNLPALVEAYGRRIVALMRRHRFDLVWIEKEALPWWPLWVERLLLQGQPYVLDFDDSIFHNYDLNSSAVVRRIYGRRIDRLMAGARLITAGNQYLADRAVAAGAPWVEIIPTVVDLPRYAAKDDYSVATTPRVVWIGSPTTTQYLLELAEPLRLLTKRLPFTLRVIGGDELVMPGVAVEALSWSAEAEAASIVGCDVGIMPLRDTPWERGKCAYKLIQYMACGLPTVASPIGANRDVVIEGKTGFFATTSVDWVDKLELLLRDKAMRQRMGQAGRRRVETQYSLQQVAPRLLDLLLQAGRR